jgi:hypothetical protein
VPAIVRIGQPFESQWVLSGVWLTATAGSALELGEQPYSGTSRHDAGGWEFHAWVVAGVDTATHPLPSSGMPADSSAKRMRMSRTT